MPERPAAPGYPVTGARRVAPGSEADVEDVSAALTHAATAYPRLTRWVGVPHADRLIQDELYAPSRRS